MTRAIVREFDLTVGENISEKAIAIVIKDKNGIIMPSPLSNFIKSEYINKGLSLQSQKKCSRNDR